jgi:hypothetical protein
MSKFVAGGRLSSEFENRTYMQRTQSFERLKYHEISVDRQNPTLKTIKFDKLEPILTPSSTIDRPTNLPSNRAPAAMLAVLRPAHFRRKNLDMSETK